MKELREIVRLFETNRERRFALATLVRAHGSTYRRPGARMLIGENLETAGSLSAGCLEEEVAAQSFTVIATGEARLLHFDTRLRFGCNGSIEILLERVQPDFLEELCRRIRARKEISLVTEFAGLAPAGTRFSYDATSESFPQMIPPAIRLLIFGDFPDSKPLRELAEALGWEVSQLREAGEIPDELDQRTAAIVKSHNYGRDYAALRKLLPVGLPYLGLIGPRARRDQLLHVFMEEGLARESDLFAPAGLDLGAETPEEIALALIAEIQMTFAAGTGESLRDRRAPIHANIAPPHSSCATVSPR